MSMYRVKFMAEVRTGVQLHHGFVLKPLLNSGLILKGSRSRFFLGHLLPS
jgi:hypothetical protein